MPACQCRSTKNELKCVTDKLHMIIHDVLENIFYICINKIAMTKHRINNGYFAYGYNKQ